MKIILGLGNPGLRFRFSRHNMGFLTVKALSLRHRIKLKQKKYQCLLGPGVIENTEIILGMPLTFMNLSGQAIKGLIKENELKPQDLLIVCDDINLPLGKIRLRASGSAGGHNGLKSIIQSLGSEDFARLRIGVDRPKTSGLTRHVLGRFNKQQTKIMEEKLEVAVEAAETWIRQGIHPAMNQFN